MGNAVSFAGRVGWIWNEGERDCWRKTEGKYKQVSSKGESGLVQVGER